MVYLIPFYYIFFSVVKTEGLSTAPATSVLELNYPLPSSAQISLKNKQSAVKPAFRQGQIISKNSSVNLRTVVPSQNVVRKVAVANNKAIVTGTKATNFKSIGTVAANKDNNMALANALGVQTSQLGVKYPAPLLKLNSSNATVRPSKPVISSIGGVSNSLANEVLIHNTAGTTTNNSKPSVTVK